MSGSLSKRMQVFKRDGWICQICFEPVSFPVRADRCRDVEREDWEPTIDHVIPRSLGGPDEIDNLRLAHRKCNLDRGNRADLREVEGWFEALREVG